MVEKNQRPIECGSVRVSFIARKKIGSVSVQSFNTPRGIISVSTVEATTVDLAGYPKRAGGLDQVATILAELAEKIDPKLASRRRESRSLIMGAAPLVSSRTGGREGSCLLVESVCPRERQGLDTTRSGRKTHARARHGAGVKLHLDHFRMICSYSLFVSKVCPPGSEN
jgi:hypothetical protein